jgi:hypothetical protein
LQKSKRITTLKEMSAQEIKRACRQITRLKEMSAGGLRKRLTTLEGEPEMHLGRQARDSRRSRNWVSLTNPKWISAVKQETTTSKRLQQRIFAAALGAAEAVAPGDLCIYPSRLESSTSRRVHRLATAADITLGILEDFTEHRKELQEGMKPRKPDFL